MKNGRKEILRGEKRFLKDPKNDGNCRGGWGAVGIGTVNQAGLD